MNQLEPDDAEWVRGKIAERGMTEEIEAEAARVVAYPSHDPMQAIAVRIGVAAVLFVIFGGILRMYDDVPWWAYIPTALFCIAISK